MAVIIGGTEEFPGKNNRLVGTEDEDFIFGDPYTTGAGFFDEESNPIDIPQIGGALSSGRGGNDWIEGRGGFDEIYGDAWEIRGTAEGGNDYLKGGGLVGDADVMSGHARGGSDYLVGTGSHTRLVGDAFSMSDHARGGNDLLDNSSGGVASIVGDSGDTMSGSARGGDDWLIGGKMDDILLGDGLNIVGINIVDSARGGSDVLFGGAGNDELIGDAFSIGGHTRGGDDLLIGGAGNDVLEGDATYLISNAQGNARGGSDALIGGAGEDRLVGDADIVGDHTQGGNDYLVGGEGDDILFGDFDLQASIDEGITDFSNIVRGADTFIFTPSSGLDNIGDFQSGKDTIDLSAYGITKFADLTIETRAGATIIDLDKRAANINEITLDDIVSLRAGDFVFA
ncbi:MAG TPA: calcium-binding protein [Geminicoccus sp.]|jgi:Ca2+-binding RTX toxin-like protein|uniref:calcium-binding protein n=1 Tax=Geminicoccus sp. TaxID=2024832 RepID=UPI002E366C66|nr:calcium-binding protein [Geminicoccus sp.]HEX2527166.1 calcium-binding protein [Geminicoccus sp.]